MNPVTLQVIGIVCTLLVVAFGIAVQWGSMRQFNKHVGDRLNKTDSNVDLLESRVNTHGERISSLEAMRRTHATR